MKNLSKLLLVAALVSLFFSCGKQERASATFSQGVSFEMTDAAFEQYFRDSLMYTPLFSLDQLIFFNTSCDDLNQGYAGGFKISTMYGGEDTSDDMAVYASADAGAGVGNTLFYMTFNQTYSMPDYDIYYFLENYYTADTQILGCSICNTLYNSRLAKQGLISSGDYLKVTFEFFKNGASVGSIDKYLIDYRGAEPVMIDEWETWDMAQEALAGHFTIGSFDHTKIRCEVKGSAIKPCFCMDNFLVQFSVTY